MVSPIPGMPEELHAEDCRQAVVILSAFTDDSGARFFDDVISNNVDDANRVEPERIKRVCDLLNAFGGQLAAMEGAMRAQAGMAEQAPTSEMRPGANIGMVYDNSEGEGKE